MKIAFITHMEPQTCPTERLWVAAARELHATGEAEIGVSVADPSQQKNPEFWDQVEPIAASFQRRSFKSASPRNRLQNRLKPELGFFDPHQQLRSWLREFSPDFAYISQGGNLDSIPAQRACREESIPFAVGAHAAAYTTWLPDDERDEAAALYLSAKKVFSDSLYNLEITETVLGIELPSKCRVTNPMNPSIMEIEELPEWPSEDSFRMACVARLEPAAKGQDILFKVLASPSWKSRPWHLTLAGKGPQERLLRDLAEQMGISEKIDFIGHVDDIRTVWFTSHLCVLPSRYEGLPIALYEAFQCGRPAVITRETGGFEILEDGQHGFVADHASESALAQALERGWEQRSSLEEMGRSARQHVQEVSHLDPPRWFADELIALAEKNMG